MRKKLKRIFTVCAAIALPLAAGGQPDLPKSLSGEDFSFLQAVKPEMLMLSSEPQYDIVVDPDAFVPFMDFVAKSFPEKEKKSPIPEGLENKNQKGLAKGLQNLNYLTDESTEAPVYPPTFPQSEESGKPFAVQALYDDGGELPIAVYDVVRDYGAAADGSEDASWAINAALSDALVLGGGTVFLPEGVYKCEDLIMIPSTVTLLGEWQSPDMALPGSSGTVLIADNDELFLDDPVVYMAPNSGFKNCTILYPNQSAEQPKEYFAAVQGYGRACQTVENVTILGAWNGVDLTLSHEVAYLHNLYISALNIGIASDKNSDVDRYENIQCDPIFWMSNTLRPMSDAQKSIVLNYFRTHATGLKYGRIDWSFYYDITVRNHKYGIYFDIGYSGTMKFSFDGQFNKVKIADCDIGIHFEETKIGGAKFSDVQITTSRPATAGIDTSEILSGGNLFQDTVIDGDFKYPVRSRGMSGGSSGSLQFVSSRISGYDSAKNYAVTVTGGSVTLQQCAITGAARHINVPDKSIQSLSVLGCTFGGKPDFSIHPESTQSCYIDHTPLELAETSGRGHVYRASIPRPVSRNVFNVEDFGASADSTDNTKAFQSALDKARLTGGTVYIPGGNWAVPGTLTVPSGVELRGAFQMQQFPDRGGTVLWAYSGKDDENGTPFITLEAGAGVRGFSIYYPEQVINETEAVKYPWSVRSTGYNCWAVNIGLINAYNGLDFGTRPSNGHYIDRITGAPLRRGVFVGNNSGNGWVQNCQFNPNFARFIGSGGSNKARLYYCDAFIFGDNASEHVLNNFVYEARNGMMFFSQNGRGTNGTVIGNGVDGDECGLRIYQLDTVEFLNLQITAGWSLNDKINFITEKSFTGTAAVFCSQFWGSSTWLARVKGGNVIFSNINLATGQGLKYALFVDGGSFEGNSIIFHNRSIKISDAAKSVKLLGCYTRGLYSVISPLNESSGTLEVKHSWWS